MEILDPSMFDSISGGRGNNGGDRADNDGKTKGSSKNDGNKSGGFYGKHTSPDCVNGMLVGMALEVLRVWLLGWLKGLLQEDVLKTPSMAVAM